MQINKKFISRMTRFYGLIVVISNIIAIIIPNAISNPLGNSENLIQWEAFLKETKITNIGLFLAFLVPTIICISYSAKIFKTEEKIIGNVAEIPSVFSLSSVIGWNLYYFVEIPFVIYAKMKIGIEIKSILISSWTFTLISGMTSWTISYLSIELLNRAILLPKVFPDGHITHNRRSVHPRFSHLLIFCFMVSSAFPIGILLASHISMQIKNNLPVNTGIVSISVLFLIFALTITISLSKIIIKPLGKLTNAAKRIKDGDYKTKVSVVTADELGTLADSFNDMTESLAEKEFMRDTFGKVVDPEVRDYLMSGAGRESLGASLGGETRIVTVLFCDIRSFTAMSEKMEATKVVTLLNKYFTALGECITRNHGIINKYIGDAIMAIFGAPVESENSALDAFYAATEMREALVRVNKEFLEENLPQLKFGIGIHTGTVFAGTIGAANRMEYTVIGDTVNTASRLESLCKIYKTDLLISDASRVEIEKNGAELNFIADTEIRGKEEKMKIFTYQNQHAPTNG